MKFINKHKLYPALVSFIPPIILKLLKKTSFFYKIKNIVNKFTIEDHKPKWHKIVSGPLKGRELFIESGEVWDSFLNNNYDNFLFDYLKKIDLKGKTILDIGAHIGYSSLNFAEIVGKNGKVYSFEPNITNIERFKKILTKNTDLSKRIEIINQAISNKEKEEIFIFSDNVDGGTSSGSFIDSANTLWEKEVYEKKVGFKRTKVKTIPLDNIEKILNKKIDPTLIKIDIEGAEYLALAGGKNYIKKYKPTLLIEVHSIFNMYAVQKTLDSLEYKTKIIHEEKDGRCFITANPNK